MVKYSSHADCVAGM